MKSQEAWQWLGGLSMVCLGLAWIRKRDDDKNNVVENTETKLKHLHWNYLGLHFFIRLADWLQGTNMYTLYVSYGVDPGALFIVGFITSAMFSTFSGLMVDKFGRKKGCIVYCVLEVIIQIIEHFPNFWLLMFGRVLGGLSTCILFSAFESWVVTAHRKKYPNDNITLEKMFAIASTLNGVSAVLAGLVARVAFSYAGEIGPFQVSLGITVICLIWILVEWEENKGAENQTFKEANSTDVKSSVFRRPEIVALALTQAGFEGCMFTFVFVWVQTFLSMAETEPTGRPPIEILFSCLMVALSIGGLTFDLIQSRIQQKSKEWIGALLFYVSSIAMACAGMVLAPSQKLLLERFFSPQTLIMLSFCLFEMCVGMFDPWIAIMRSVHIPERVMATVMTLARLPLNILVGMGVHLTENYSLVTVFCALALFHLSFALAGTYVLIFSSNGTTKTKSS